MRSFVKPNVIGVVASLLLVASVATVLDPPARPGLVVDDGDLAAAPEDEGTSGLGQGGALGDGSEAPNGSVTDPLATETPTDGGIVALPTEDTTADAASASGGSGASGAGAGTAPAPASGSAGTGATAPQGSSGSGSGAAPRAAASGPREAPIYSASAKTIGISKDRVFLCGHAALTLASAFDTRPEDLNVYWEIVNAAGGVHGRAVEVDWVDDAYSPNQAVSAAETCKSRDPFLLLGGIGFDQIPAVRNWAEANQLLYLHHIATTPQTTGTYSFTLSPSVEQTGKAFGEHIARNYRSKRIGILYRQSENWAPGRAAGVAELKKRGITPTRDLPVTNGQGVYSQQLTELASAGVEVVWIWENALNAAQVIQQASQQGYRPTWVVFPFQTTLDVLNQAGGQTDRIDGVAAWPSYAPGGYGGAFPDFEFDAEIKRFEAAYAKLRPNSTPNDLLWQVWVGNKVLHDMLETCGPDCNRNRFAGMMLDGYRKQTKPGCLVDFSDPRSRGGHAGSFSFFAQQTFTRGSTAFWKTTRYCVSSLA
ncbi:MAG: ABC transporter substrate-binding protein [Actinomycetes bacterium]